MYKSLDELTTEVQRLKDDNTELRKKILSNDRVLIAEMNAPLEIKTLDELASEHAAGIYEYVTAKLSYKAGYLYCQTEMEKREVILVEALEEISKETNSVTSNSTGIKYNLGKSQAATTAIQALAQLAKLGKVDEK